MKLPEFSLTDPRHWLFAGIINFVLLFWTIAAAIHYTAWPLELKAWAIVFWAAGPPNLIVGGGMRLFGVEEGRYFLFLGRTWILAAIGLMVFFALG